MKPDVTILYDSVRWEEKALLEAGKKKGINIQMLDCKKLSLDLEKKSRGVWNGYSKVCKLLQKYSLNCSFGRIRSQSYQLLKHRSVCRK